MILWRSLALCLGRSHVSPSNLGEVVVLYEDISLDGDMSMYVCCWFHSLPHEWKAKQSPSGLSTPSKNWVGWISNLILYNNPGLIWQKVHTIFKIRKCGCSMAYPDLQYFRRPYSHSFRSRCAICRRRIACHGWGQRLYTTQRSIVGFKRYFKWLLGIGSNERYLPVKKNTNKGRKKKYGFGVFKRLLDSGKVINS